MNSTFNQLLIAFKKRESDHAEVIMPFLEDARLVSGMLAWQALSILYSPDEKCELIEEKSQWEWMWSRIRWDAKRFAIIANVKFHEAAMLLERLKSLRLVYPDGTANSLARNYLRACVKEKLTGINKKVKELDKELEETMKDTRKKSDQGEEST